MIQVFRKQYYLALHRIATRLDGEREKDAVYSQNAWKIA